MRKRTIAGHALRCLMSLLLALGPFLGVMVVKPQPAQAVDAEACYEMVKDGAKLPVVLAAKAAEGVAIAAKAAACLSAGSQDPVQAVIILALTALAVAGEISNSEQCEQLVKTALGMAIAELFQASGLDKVLGDDVTAVVASVAGGAATDLMFNAIPPLAQWVDCGCAVAGSIGDLAALGREASDAIKEVADEASKCDPAVAKVVGFLGDAVDLFEAGIDAIGNLLGDAYCATLGDLADDKDCRPPPTWVDCTNGNGIYGGIKQVGPNTFFSDTDNTTCTCPSGTKPVVENDSVTCKCPTFGETYFGGACGCPSGEMVIAFSGVEPFCGKCPEGATTENGQCTSCGPNAAINYDKNWLGNKASHSAIDNKQVCETCGDRSLASADGKTCVACGDYMYKDTKTNTCQYCDWYNKGEILSTDGKTCISEASCGENQTLKDTVSSTADDTFKAGICDCKDGYTWYSASTGSTAPGFADSACVPQITCNPGQHPDYKSGVCVNNYDCGDKQIVMVQQKDATGGQWVVATCETCPMDKPNYKKETNTCDADPPVMPQTTTANPADWCKGDNEVWSSKSARCVICPPYTEKKGDTCVVRELSVGEKPKQPTAPPDFGNTAYNGPKCPGMYEDPRGSCCPYSTINTTGMCPTPPSGSRDTRTGCPVGYEPRGEFCVIATLPERQPPDIALRCPPGLVPQGGQCIVPVVWNEPGLHPCPGGLAQVGNWCAAALLPSPGREAPTSCPDGYTANGTYCVGATLPSRTAPTSPCEGARLPGGACLGNAGIAAAAVAAGVAGVVAGRRAGRGLPPGPYSGIEGLVQQDPAGGRGSAPKGGVTGTPALVKGTDDKGAKSGPTLGGTTFGKKSGDDTTQPKKDGGPTVKGTALKAKSGDDNVGTSKTKGKSTPKIEPRTNTTIKRDTPAPKTVTATPKLNTPTPPRPTAPALKTAPPTLKLPTAPQLKLPPPGGAGPRPLIK